MNSEQIAKVSAAIITEVGKQGSVKGAVDKVLGSGTFDAIASDLYDALRAKSNQA